MRDCADTIRNADTKVPEPLDGREADNWTPLIAIAEAAGGHWPERARSAARDMCGAAQDDDDARVTLLGDLLDLFDSNGERMASDDLVGALRAMETRPWPEWRHAKPITARGVAKLLKPFGLSATGVPLVRERHDPTTASRSFHNVLPRHVVPVVLFAYFTGWHKSEVLGLRRHQVDFVAGTVRLEPGT